MSAAAGDVKSQERISAASRRVLRSLLVDGPATASELAQRLSLTAAGVRRHLDSLLESGLIDAGDRPSYGPLRDRGRGRPPKVFSVTDAGRDSFSHSYDDLAISALRFLAEQTGETGVSAFARGRAEEFERRYLPLVREEPTAQDRAAALATGLSADGFAATISGGEPGAGLQICQHNCPVAHVAEEFPQICEEERNAIGRLLGTHVTRLATIANGDPVCTTVVGGSTQPEGEVRNEH